MSEEKYYACANIKPVGSTLKAEFHRVLLDILRGGRRTEFQYCELSSGVFGQDLTGQERARLGVLAEEFLRARGIRFHHASADILRDGGELNIGAFFDTEEDLTSAVQAGVFERVNFTARVLKRDNVWVFNSEICH